MVNTDNSFHVEADGYVGRCIHCCTSLFVSVTGETGATLEHIKPLCAGGSVLDPLNLALACARCNNEKGVRHDDSYGKNGRSDHVIDALLARRRLRWREPVQC